MPELPEVETVRRGLEPVLERRVLEAVRVRERRLRLPAEPDALRRCLDRPVVGIRRRGKYLLVDFSGARVLVVHLGMSGSLSIRDAEAPLDRHDHVVFDVAGRRGGRREQMRFRDPRRFGLVLAMSAAEAEVHPYLRSLGVDPFDATLGVEYWQRRARGSRRAIKSLLLDGRVVCGIGNIYASEALWRARIRPTTAAGRISAVRWRRLHEAVLDVLRDAIRAGGSSIRDFRDATGQPGYFAVDFRVYAREGDGCRRCGRTIRRVVQSNRSTFYCPGCQF